MLPKRRVASHPGEVLLREFLEPMNLTQVELARAIGISQNRINELVRGKRGVSPNTALMLSDYFGTSAEFWMNLQSAYELTQARMARRTTVSFPRRSKLRRHAASVRSN